MLADEWKGREVSALEEAAKSIREELIARVKENGGHLSSNLGVVELTLALHAAFDFPQDKLVFDVGHQSYVHKLITGRELDTLRRKGGVSGFPDPEESEYDAFIAGHSGTSVAAGIGLCNARDLLGENYKVISLIGDASLGNGTALEAVFSSETKPKNFVVVLNDNGMSISKNQSALYRSLSKMTAKKRYRTFNSFLSRTFKETGAFGKKLRKVKYFLKGWLNKNDFSERCGFKYIGPVNGHDLHELMAVFSSIRKMDEAVFLHAVTRKGMGYAPAEEDPARFHGTAKNFAAGEHSFSTALGRLLCDRAEKESRLVAVTAAMTEGVGLGEFSQKFPARCFDAGICEEYAVTMAAGMAKGGLLPVVCVYSTFLQRAFDQIAHDVCLQNLPVIFCIDRAGFVGGDGKTHQGLLDEAFLRAVPNLRLFAPKDCAELADIFDYALQKGGPCAVRYPNGYAPNLGGTQKISDYYLWETLSDGDSVVVLACGARAVARALDAKRLSGVNCMVVNCRSIRPLDERLLREVSNRRIIAFEEGYLSGGFGGAVAEFYASCAQPVRLKILGAENKPVPHATAQEQAQDCHLTAQDLAYKIQAFAKL